jgi:hypothetical protein
MKICDKRAWEQYCRLLPQTRAAYTPKVPASLPVIHIKSSFDYVPPEEFLADLREWISERGETTIYYFLTESTGSEPTDFELRIDELNGETLRRINVGAESVLASKNFDWAIALDHEGVVHVAGPEHLRKFVQHLVDGSPDA